MCSTVPVWDVESELENALSVWSGVDEQHSMPLCRCGPAGQHEAVCVCVAWSTVCWLEAIPYKDLEEGRMYTPDGQFRHSSLLGTPHGNT